MTMVDSEDSCPPTGHLVSVAEDDVYFKRMWSLVPSLGSTEVEPAEESKESLKAAAKKQKKAQKEKKRKQRKKEHSENKEVATEEIQLPKKHGRDEDMEYTALKQKKQKVLDSNETSTASVNHTHSSDSSDSETPSDMNNSASEASEQSSPSRNIPVKNKHKNKQGAQKTSVQSNSKQTADANGTESNVDAGPATSRVVITNDFSEKDMLQAASINSIEDKREKLRAKITGLQAKRNPTNRERFERKKLKRQENKMKMKQKRKLEKLQKNQKQTGDGSKPSKGNVNKGAMTTPVKPIYNKEGQMVFSKFDFTDSAKKEKKQTELHGKDYKRLLEKIEKRNEKINKVKNKDESAGKALEEKFKWETVLHKAEGEKVKDNPEMLKKALKRKQKMKDQKKKKWEGRVDHVEKSKEDKQKKRNENIQKRKQSVKDKKIKKLKKKGRILPGF